MIANISRHSQQSDIFWVESYWSLIFLIRSALAPGILPPRSQQDPRATSNYWPQPNASFTPSLCNDSDLTQTRRRPRVQTKPHADTYQSMRRACTRTHTHMYTHRHTRTRINIRAHAWTQARTRTYIYHRRPTHVSVIAPSYGRHVLAGRGIAGRGDELGGLGRWTGHSMTGSQLAFWAEDQKLHSTFAIHLALMNTGPDFNNFHGLRIITGHETTLVLHGGDILNAVIALASDVLSDKVV